MALQPIDPIHDSRIKHCNTEVNGKTYREAYPRLPEMSLHWEGLLIL